MKGQRMIKQHIFILALLTSMGAFAQFVSGIPANGLVSRWDFNGNATNLVTGSTPLSNSAQLTSNRFGQPNSAYHFNSYSSQIELPQYHYHNPYTDFSLSYWFRTEYELTMYPFNLLDSGLYVSNFNVVLNNNYDGMYAFWNSQGINNLTCGMLGEYNDNQWHNLVFTQQDSTFHLFIDGKLQASLTNNAVRINLNKIITLSSNSLPFYGELDDILIYNRALTAPEIRQIVDAQVNTIRIVSHKSTDAYQPGMNSRIRWFKPYGVDSLKLEYSADNGSSWNLIADHVPGDDYGYNWTVPNLPDTRCILRVSDSQNAAMWALSPVFTISKYQWQNASLNNAFGPRDGAGAYVFRDSMYLVGGWTDVDPVDYPNFTNSEVWTSTDGANWTLKATAPWESRHTFGSLVYNNKLWVVGGDQLQNHFQNDVWNSADGVNWTQVTASVPWDERMTHICCVFNNKLWVMGGQKIVGWNNTIDTTFNDVWNSTDGVNWTQVTSQAAWSPRGQIGGNIVFNNKMWIIGGGTYNGTRQFFNDVWNSSDGLNWTLVTSQAPWAKRQYVEVMAYDNAMWVIGGYDGTDNRRDVWYSSDGITWLELKDSPFMARHAASVFNYKQSLWVVAGNLWNDSWRLNTLLCPRITAQPADIDVPAGQNAVLTVASTATNTTYQWQARSSMSAVWNNLSNGTKYAGVNTGSLVITNVKAADDHSDYRCLLANGACEDTSRIALLTVSGVSGLPHETAESVLSLYPNPAAGSLTVSYSANLEAEYLRISDPQGKRLCEQKASARQTILDVSTLSSGLYFLEVHGKEQRVLKKFIKL